MRFHSRSLEYSHRFDGGSVNVIVSQPFDHSIIPSSSHHHPVLVARSMDPRGGMRGGERKGSGEDGIFPRYIDHSFVQNAYHNFSIELPHPYTFFNSTILHPSIMMNVASNFLAKLPWIRIFVGVLLEAWSNRCNMVWR